MTTCLVIEDSDRVRAIMCRLLGDDGCETAAAEGPAEALRLLKTSSFDALFLDWDLPDFGALEILRELNGVGDRPDIILCVTHNEPRELALARAAGGKHILMKPYNKDSVAEAVALIGSHDDSLESASKSA